MSSQSDRGISFSIKEPQQNVRLLELPPDLLELLTGPNPPKLEIKSSNSDSSAVVQTSPSSPAHAVLCTPTKTFNLRQVQTSNSVLLCTSTGLQSGSSSAENLSGNGICAIATCPTTLEAIPISPSRQTALPHLQNVLRSWNGPDDQIILSNSPSVTKKFALFADIPVSEGECAAAWSHLCVFEDAQGRCWNPTPVARIGAWTSLLRWMVAKGWDMHTTCRTWEEGKSARMGRMVGEVEREEGWPIELARAVLSRVGVLEENENAELERVRIDPELLVQWTGEILLAAKTQGSDGISTEEFVQGWRDVLPEPWVGKASLDKIRGSFANPSPSTIQYTEGGQMSGASLPNASGGKAGSRKWHEKFKQKRK